jgi:hypothetical protein
VLNNDWKGSGRKQFGMIVIGEDSLKTTAVIIQVAFRRDLHKNVTVKQSRSGLDRPWGFQGFEAPQISTQSAHENGKVFSPTHRPPLLPKKYSWCSFLLAAESFPRPKCDPKDYVNKKFQWHRESNRRLPDCSTVPQPTAPDVSTEHYYYTNVAQTQMKCVGIAPRILNLSPRWRRIVSLPPFSKKRALHYFRGSREGLQVSENWLSRAPTGNRKTIPHLSNP